MAATGRCAAPGQRGQKWWCFRDSLLDVAAFLLSGIAALQILLGFVIAEIVGLLTALVLRCCVDPDGHYGARCSSTLTFLVPLFLFPAFQRPPLPGRDIFARCCAGL